MSSDLLSPRLYNRTSEDWGDYKVIEMLDKRGKTKVQYYRVKFKDSGNIIEVPEKTILNNKVVDIEKKKRQTVKKQKQKKKDFKQDKKEFKSYIIGIANPIMLSLDLSTHSTGWSVFKEGELLAYGYIYQSKSERWATKRINYMKFGMLEIIDKYNINCVVMEDVILKNKVSLSVLSRLQGVVQDSLFDRGIKYATITPMEWKTGYDINKYSDWKGSNSREESKMKTVLKVNKEFGLELEKEYFDSPKDLSEPCWYDVSDSIGLGKFMIDNRVK